MDPAPNASLEATPQEVVIRFSERIEPRPSTLEVLDARGQRVDRGGAVVEPADPWRYRVAVQSLPAGAYTVSWRVLSADDGHVTHGAHVFTVGVAAGTGGQSARTVRSGAGWRPLARWMVALGGALLLGALVAGPLIGVGAAWRASRMEVLGGLGVAVGGTLDLVLQAHDLAGPRRLGETLLALLAAPPGRVWLIRGGLLLALAGVGRAGGRRWLRVGLAAAVVMTGGLVSHGASAPEGRGLILAAEALHLLAMASWAGGLLGFATVFWGVGSGRGGTPEVERLALAILRFSGLAVLAVGSLAVTGLLLARLHLGGWGELIGTGYGRWLAAKLAVFAAMLALGGWHQGRIGPALVGAIGRGETAPGPAGRFRRSIRIEAGLGVVALALAGTLGVTAPPARPGASAPPSTGFVHEQTVDAARVRLEIAPLRPGPNAIRLRVTDLAGGPLADATAAMVQVTPADAGVGAVTFSLERTGPGQFVAPAAVLGLVGRWTGRLVVQRTDAYDVNDRFELVVSDQASSHAHGEPAGPVQRALPLDRVTGGAALATAAITLALFLRSRCRLAAARRLLADTPGSPASLPASR
jgi:copper transport protein